MNAPRAAASDAKHRMKIIFLLTLAVLFCPPSFSQEAAPKEVAAPAPKIYVTGGVKIPQSFACHKEYTLMTVIGLAGGTSDFGRTTAYLIRYGAGTKYDLGLISRGREKDPELLPWDVVHVGN